MAASDPDQYDAKDEHSRLTTQRNANKEVRETASIFQAILNKG